MLDYEDEDYFYSQHQVIARELEDEFPELELEKFDDGTYPGWGLCPEQIMGYWNGNPFYYRYRSNCASLLVWDKEVLSISEIPNHMIEPILCAYINDVVPGDEYASGDGTGETFRKLVAILHAPEGDDFYGVRTATLDARQGLLPGKEVSEAFRLVYPEYKALEREASWDNAAECFVVSPSGFTVRLQHKIEWDRVKQKHAKVFVVSVYPKGVNPLKEHSMIAMASFPTGDYFDVVFMMNDIKRLTRHDFDEGMTLNLFERHYVNQTDYMLYSLGPVTDVYPFKDGYSNHLDTLVNPTLETFLKELA